MKETIDLMELAREARRNLEKKQDRLVAELTDVDNNIHLMDGIDELLEENRRQKDEIADLQEQLAEEKRQRAELEMNLAEIRKLSDGMAKKSSEEGVIKALQIFVNRSKRKTADKRIYIKNVILELAIANGLTLPDDLAATIESLDDEQAVPINVAGDYVEHKHIEKEVANVEAGGVGFETKPNKPNATRRNG